jgi:hypothetical protein
MTVESSSIVTSEPDSDAPQRKPSAHAKLIGDLASLVGAASEGVVTYVYRIDNSGRKVPNGAGSELYLARLDGPPDFDEIRSRWGGGFYEVMVQKRGGQMITSSRFGIDGDPKPVTPEAVAEPEVAGVRATDATSLAVALTTVLSPVFEQLAGTMKLIAERQTTPPPAPPVDQLAMVREVVTMMRETQPAPAAPEDNVDRMLSMFERGMKLGRESEGAGPICVDHCIGQHLVSSACQCRPHERTIV